jgi:hypothetical protein
MMRRRAATGRERRRQRALKFKQCGQTYAKLAYAKLG